MTLDKSKKIFLFFLCHFSNSERLIFQVLSLKSSLFRYKMSYSFINAGNESKCFCVTFFLFNLCCSELKFSGIKFLPTNSSPSKITILSSLLLISGKD